MIEIGLYFRLFSRNAPTKHSKYGTNGYICIYKNQKIMARHSFSRINPIDCLKELRGKVLGADLSTSAMGSMLFSQDGVIVTDDIEDEFIPESNPPIVVETKYAQELSWLMAQFRDGLFDVITYFSKSDFYGRLADAANAYLLVREDDRRGLLMAVLLEATMLTAESLEYKNQAIKDEVLACVGSLSDVAEKI